MKHTSLILDMAEQVSATNSGGGWELKRVALRRLHGYLGSCHAYLDSITVSFVYNISKASVNILEVAGEAVEREEGEMCMRFSRNKGGDEGNQFCIENNGLYLCTGSFVFLCDLQAIERHSDDD